LRYKPESEGGNLHRQKGNTVGTQQQYSDMLCGQVLGEDNSAAYEVTAQPHHTYIITDKGRVVNRFFK
jgi:hypothetical protein